MEKNLNFLTDTNIWLERLLDQEHSNEVKDFLEIVPTKFLFISDFTVHSIGVILFRNKKPHLFHEFVNDLFGQGNLKVLSLNPFDQVDLIELNIKQKLDFDDLVTFDRDFKRSKIKVLNPTEAVQLYRK